MGRREDKFTNNAKTKRMKISFVASLVIICVSVLSSCSSGEVVANTQKNSVRTENRPTSNTSVNGAADNLESAEAANSSLDTAANRFKKKMDGLRSSAENNTSTKPFPVNSRSAPEDSTITTQLTDLARE